MNNEIYFENGCWNFISKSINAATYQIIYTPKSGYLTYEAALKDYEKDKKFFDKNMKKLKKVTGIHFSFTGYLNYWYQNILKTYAFGSYQAGCAWVIYDLIIPHVEQDVLLNMVTSSYINKILKKVEPACKTAAYEARKIISIAMKDALADGYIQKNPMCDVNEYPSGRPKMVMYTKEQLKKLLAATYDYHSIYLEVLLAMFLGLRSGEIFGLKYTDFNYEEKTVTISRQITNDYDVSVDNNMTYIVQSSSRTPKPPKSFSSYRILRVPQFIFDELEIRKQENEKLLSRTRVTEEWSEYICLGRSGRIKSANTCLNALDTICKRNGLPKISMHDLRHVYASILIEMNVPLEKISKLMGHKSVGTTFDIYCGIIQGKEDIRKFIEENLKPIKGIRGQ